MKFTFNRARLSALSLACVSAFSANAQSDSKGTLGEVVVTASRFAESADVLPYGVSVITAKEIEASGASSVSEAIMKLLGVPGRLDLTGGNNYTLDLRGFGQTAESNQVVIVDGVRINEQDLSATGLGAVAIESVQRIEVIRGGAGVVYGEGASGGVIVLTTKAGLGVSRKNSGYILGSVGNFGVQEFQSGASLSSGGMSLDVTGSDRKTDGHRDNFASRNNNLSATVQWSNDWIRAGLQSSRNLMHGGTPGSLNSTQYATDPYQANVKYKAAFNQIKSESSNVFAEAFFGDWALGFDAGERTKKYDNENPFYTPFDSYLSAVSASSANLRAKHSWSSQSFKNSLAIGLDSDTWKRIDMYDTHAKSEASALYLTDDITYVSTGTRVSGGVRNATIKKSLDFSTSNQDDQPVAWHLGLSQPLGSGFSAFARTGQSYRLANVDEVALVLPGQTLKTQQSRDIEVGSRWSDSTGRVELRLYRADLTHEIGYIQDIPNANSFNGFGANVNFDQTQRQGLELDARREVSSSLALRFAASSRQAVFMAGSYSGNDIPLTPRQTVAIGAEWKPLAGHLVDVGLNWVAAQKVDFSNTCTVPPFSSLDARYAYSIKNLELALAIGNLADAKYYTAAYDCTDSVTQGIYPEPGRSVAATAKLRF